MDIEQLRRNARMRSSTAAMKHQITKEIKNYRDSREDTQFENRELLKPIIDTQKEVKETIDKKQNKLIEKLQENQLALTRGFQNVVDANQDISTLQFELLAIEGEKQERGKKEPSYLSVDNRFNKKYGLEKNLTIIEFNT